MALEQEITALKARLLELERVQQREHDGELHFRLLDLPRELRNSIYEYCLVPGKIFVYRPHYIKSDDMRLSKPRDRAELQLLRVNKQVYTEAAEIYYSSNLFILLSGCFPDFRERNQRYAAWLYPSSMAKKYIRRVSISLDYRESTSVLADFAVQCIRPRKGPSDTAQWAPDYMQLHHAISLELQAGQG